VLKLPRERLEYVRERFAPHIIIHGITAEARFPDVLKLPRERLELLQLGWTGRGCM